MQNRFMKIVLVLLTLMSTISLFGVISKEAAIDLVLNEIIPDDVGKVNIYIKNNTVSKNDGLNLHKGRHVDITYDFSWVFFVNDLPGARWLHPCRYIAINTENGDYEITDERIYPAVEYDVLS